jgi:hypothetical protein
VSLVVPLPDHALACVGIGTVSGFLRQLAEQLREPNKYTSWTYCSYHTYLPRNGDEGKAVDVEHHALFSAYDVKTDLLPLPLFEDRLTYLG